MLTTGVVMASRHPAPGQERLGGAVGALRSRREERAHHQQAGRPHELAGQSRHQRQGQDPEGAAPADVSEQLVFRCGARGRPRDGRDGQEVHGT
jgi:hypothetical protein